MAKKSTLASLVSLGLSSGLLVSTVSPELMAAESAWDCRISADGSSWDCYKDGNLVMQPMPQPVTPIPAVITAPAVTTTVPDNTKPLEAPGSETPPATSTETEKAAAVTEMPEPAQPVTQAIEETAEKPAPLAVKTTETVEPEAVTEIPGPVKPATQATKKTVEKPVDEPAPLAVKTTETEKPGSEPEIISPPRESSSAGETQPGVEQPGTEKAPAVEAAVTETAAKSGQPEYCRARPQKIIRQKAPAGETQTLVNADDAVMRSDTGIADLKGDVVLISGDQTIRSDSLQYNTNTSDVHAEGNLDYKRPDLAIQGTSATMNLDTEIGNIKQATYSLQANNARGTTEQINLVGDGVSVYQNATYTTCAPGNDDWVFSAEEVELDQNTGVGTAKNMKLYFMDTPIVYLPWATFPLDDRRKSGFLVPSVGSSDETGFDLSIPYYFNLAPNYDATFVPRIMTERGLSLGGELRYLDEQHTTQFVGEILPDDDKFTDNDPRGAASLKHNTRFSNRLYGSLDLNYVSDDTYFEDLGSSLTETSTRYLERTGTLRYNGDFYSITGVVQEYQVISGSELYKKLPQITLNGSRDIKGTDFTIDLHTQYTNWDHDSAVKGDRFDIMPSIAYDWRRSWGFLKPKLSARYTSYDLDNQIPGQESSIDRTTSTFSLDGGLIFERDTSWFGTQSTQTLEPRIFYLYTPEEDQNDIPLFDSGLYTFSNASLFRENRFTGADRVGDANQITLALTSRLLSNQTSKEFLTATLGQIFFFEDRSVQLTSATPASTADSSSYIATLRSNPSDNWLIDGGLMWDSDFEDAEKASLRIIYEDDDRHLFSIRYTLDDTLAEPLEYTKISAYWPVAFNTRLVGHSYYSLEENRAIETVAGIEYGSSCCWRLRALARDYQINAAQDSNLSFLLQLELSGFAQLGMDIDSFLEETIEGFVRETN